MKNCLITVFWVVLFAVAACKNNTDTIEIKGNLTNLPDGIMQITTWRSDTLASTPLKDGKFHFKLSKKQFPEPILVSLCYIDKIGNKAILTFRTDDRPHYFGNIMLEDGIEINYIVEDFKSSNQLNAITIKNPIKCGPETALFYKSHLDKRWNMRATNDINKLQSLVKDHSYSFFYLSVLEEKSNYMTKTQFFSIFNFFDDKVKQSKSGQKLAALMQNKGTKNLDGSIELIGVDGARKAIIDEDKKLQMIVFWASWCGPCRAEIPELKKIHSRFGEDPDFKITSVSYDEDTKAWRSAMAYAQMSWEQLLMPEELKIHQYDLFQFKNELPTSILIDKTGKIIHKSVGFDKEKGLIEIEKFIEKQLANS